MPLQAWPTHKEFTMHSESRKAARDSFAQQRSRLLFATKPGVIPADGPKLLARSAVTEPAIRRDIVRKGLIGFVPSGRL